MRADVPLAELSELMALIFSTRSPPLVSCRLAKWTDRGPGRDAWCPRRGRRRRCPAIQSGSVRRSHRSTDNGLVRCVDTPPLFAFGSRKGAIEDIGNTWAALYAADDPEACSYMGQGLCKLEPLPMFRASFEGATVQEIGFLNGYQAGARFSNGIVVEFFGDGGTWTIVRLAATERRFFE